MKALFTVDELVELMSAYRSASPPKQHELKQAAREQKHQLTIQKAQMETLGQKSKIVNKALVALADFLAFTNLEDSQQIDYMISIQQNPRYYEHGRTR